MAHIGQSRLDSGFGFLSKLLHTFQLIPSSLGSGRAHASYFSLLLSSLKLSDTKVYEPDIRARLGTAAHSCKVVVLKFRTVPIGTALNLRILRGIRRGAQAVYKRGPRMAL